MIPRDLHVITTRAATGEERKAAERRGILLHEMPLTATMPVQPDPAELKKWISKDVPWVFTSRNGVKWCREAIEGMISTEPGAEEGIRFPAMVFAVGPGTAREAESIFSGSFQWNRQSDSAQTGQNSRFCTRVIIPELHNGTGLAKQILQDSGIGEVIHWCGRRRRQELREHLEAGGVSVHEVIVYDTMGISGADGGEQLSIHSSRNTTTSTTALPTPDAVLFYSPSAVEALDGLENRPEWPQHTPLIAIGATTARALRMSGLAGPNGESRIFTADEATPDSMMDLAVKLNALCDE